MRANRTSATRASSGPASMRILSVLQLIGGWRQGSAKLNPSVRLSAGLPVGRGLDVFDVSKQRPDLLWLKLPFRHVRMTDHDAFGKRLFER